MAPPTVRSSVPTRRYAYLPTILVFGASLIVLAVLNPQLLLTANTPTGGDMGAHVLGPAYLRDVLLPQGRVLGWSDSWFAGFPVFYFYFPLPSLVIVALDVFLPYGVAFKIVTALGLVALPPATAFMVRSFGASRQLAAVAAAGAAAFALMESFTIYGGNVASTMAGEFSYSWSFSLGMVYFGLLARAIEDRRWVKHAGVVLALTALSHILTTIVIVLASIPVLFRRRAALPTVGTWTLGFAIAGFWAVPLLARIGLTADMGWNPLSRLEEILPIELWLPLPLAVAGMVVFVRRYRGALPVMVATLLPLVYFPLPRLMPLVIPSLGEGHWKLWNGRLLPYWYFGINLFAALAVGMAAGWLARRLPERLSPWWSRGLVAMLGVALGWLIVFRDAPTYAGWLIGGLGVVAAAGLWLADQRPIATRNLLATVAVVVIGVGALSGTNFVYKWARWNYSGYEGKQTFAEYEGLMQEVAVLPAGRIQWEQDSTEGTGLNKYGTPMAPMLYPYWTDWSHPSMEGLFFESSLTTPFMFLASNEMSLNGSTPVSGLDYHGFDFDRGVEHMKLYGVRYYVSYSSEAAAKARSRADLRLVAATPDPPPVADQPRIEPVEFQPVVLQTNDANGADGLPLAVDGPEEWARVQAATEAERIPTGFGPDAAGAVQVERGEESTTVTFETVAVGIPHLVEVPHSPNWGLAGAEGPYEAFGSGMYIVPTQEAVTIEFIPTFSVFELDEHHLVEPARRMPSVFEAGPPDEGEEVAKSFDDFAFDWYGSIETLDRPVVADGPAGWPRASSVAELPDVATGASPEDVSEVEFSSDRISFTTEAVGVPHVVKMSYFPNWKASGAEGPYRVTPTLMMVVPSEPEVVLEFRATWAEVVGNLLTVGGVVTAAALFWSARRRQDLADPQEAAEGAGNALHE